MSEPDPGATTKGQGGPTALSAVRRGFKRPDFDFATQTLTLLTAAGFAASSVFNSLIFYFWGLNFLQIASPEDVLMSGLDSVARIALISSAIFLAFLASRYFAYLLIHSGKQNILTILYIALGLILLGGAYWLKYTQHILFAFALFVYLSASVFFLAIHTDWYGDFVRSIKLRQSAVMVVLNGVFVLMMVVIGAFVAVAAVNTVIHASQRMIASGFGDGSHYAVPAPAACEGRVMWMGERAIVVACGPPPHPHFAVISTQNAAGLIIVDQPPSTAKP
jgi:hypothetical protein